MIYDINTNKTLTDYPRTHNGICPYRSTSAEQKHADGFREVVPFVVPEGYVTTGARRIELIDDVAYEMFDTITQDDAESTRQAAKPDNLKRAENAFLQRLAEVNAQFALDLTTDDGFQDALEKLKASTTGTQIDRLQAGMELNTLWSVVLADGGQWGDVTWHAEVAE